MIIFVGSNFDAKMRLSGYLKYIISILLLSVFAGCSRIDGILYTMDDLDGSYIAVLDNSVGDCDFNKIFPDSKSIHFNSSSEFLLALTIGKCDAGITCSEDGRTLLANNDDYDLLPCAAVESDSTLVIVHKRLLPGRNVNVHDGDFIEKSTERIYRSIISNQYWKLILRGFAATVSMLILGLLIAFALATLMLLMNSQKYLRHISRPISYFIRLIHDVPSIVLIFFFYYVVFATIHVSGIIVVSLALGVYTSGSFINIFNVHLNQIDRNQHDAARMLGLKGWNKYRYVILPQAVKPMVPLIGAEANVLLRTTAFAGFISEVDLIKVTEIIRSQTYDVLVPLLLVSVIYLLLSHIVVEGVSAIYSKMFKYD